jgi:hypothetical protein
MSTPFRDSQNFHSRPLYVLGTGLPCGLQRAGVLGCSLERFNIPSTTANQGNGKNLGPLAALLSDPLLRPVALLSPFSLQRSDPQL